MKLSLKSARFASLLSALLALPSQATPILQGASLANPDQHIDFSEIALAGSSILTDQYASLGVGFTGLYYNGCPTCIGIPTKADIGNFRNSETDVFNPEASLLFLQDADAATFRFAADFASFQVAAYLDGQLVESFDLDGRRWGTYGFSGILFDEIRISTSDPDVGAFLIDNLAFSQSPNAVPEPSSWALFILALGMLSIPALRRRRS